MVMRVYLDPTAVTIEGWDEGREEPPSVPVPGVEDAIRRLAEARYQIVAMSPLPDAVRERLGIDVPVATAVPPDGDGHSWLITADPSACQEMRRRGIRTILVGPRRAPTPGPLVRCDLEARDLASAVIEIMANEAMPRQAEPESR
jgi:hypothetical protein